MLLIYCLLITILVSFYAFAIQIISANYRRPINFVVGVLGVMIILMLSGLTSLFAPKFVSVFLLTMPIIWLLRILLSPKKQKALNIKGIVKDVQVENGGFVAWILIVFISSILTLTPLNKHENLPDGPYVYKTWITPVANQWAAGDMPPDNSLPYFTAEFLVRDLPLNEVHPIMPGQEIVNRTFGVPFIYLSFRQFFNYGTDKVPVPDFEYVDTSWPNITALYDEQSYLLYNAVSIVLNGFLGFVIFFIAARRTKLYAKGYPAAILLGLFPFLLHQTFYTWNKSFCVALSLMAIYYYLNSQKLLAGVFAAIAYQVHPMAAIFIAAIFIFGFAKNRTISARFAIFPFISMSIWQIWVGTTGLKSDLIQQNFLINQSILDHLSARIGSIGTLVNPGVFSIYPFNLRNFVNAWNLAAVLIALGFFLVLAISKSQVMARNEFENSIFRFSILVLFMTSLIFSKPVPLQFFGGQILISVLLIMLLPRITKLFEFLVFVLFLSPLLILWILELSTL